MICHEFTEPAYLFFLSDVPPLLYYSHIPVTIVALAVGLIVYFNGKTLILNKLLLSIVLLFSGWTLLNLYAWTNIHVEMLLTIWPFFGIISILIAIQSYYFTFVFLNNKDLSLRTKLLLIGISLPAFIFAPTYLNLQGFNITNCDSFGFEGPIYKNYYIFVSVALTILIGFQFIKKYRVVTGTEKKKVLLMGYGLTLFLCTFYGLTFLASYLAGIGYFEDSRIEMYGLFGMAAFLIFISTLIVQYRTFNVSLISSQVLILGLIILTASQFTFNHNILSLILTFITLLLITTIGLFLIKSVKREVKLREQIEQLAVGMEQANERLQVLDKQKSEFVSIASHQLRSPLTAIRGYVSMMVEGTFGKLPAEATEALGRIQESTIFMASSIDDFLEVSRIESGNMKYDYSDVNFKDQAEHIVDDLRADAVKRGLMLLYRSDMQGTGLIRADAGKTQQILHNLINNALKYTPKGSVTVYAHDDTAKRKMYVDIIDTGLGLSQESIVKLFGKFARAKIASSANIMGTGLGLFVAREMARAMGGDITVHSDGEGRGSTFTIVLPLI